MGIHDEFQYKRWMVGLDFSSMDEVLIRYTNDLSKVFKPEKIYFFHVEKNFETPSYLPNDFENVTKTFDESQKDSLSKLVAKHFNNNNVDVQCEVIEGALLETLIHWSHVKEIDFFIAGRKSQANGSGILPDKLSRKLSCPVLFIPERQNYVLEKILVPIDFSEHSRIAVQTAIQLADLNKNSLEINCLHVYQVPIGYYKTGKSYEEFAEIMKQNAEKKYKQFISQFNRPISCSYLLQGNESAAEMIFQGAKDISPDLIILGSRGLTISSLILIGSTTEKVIRTIAAYPVWVVKKKGENIGFFEALK